MLLKNKIKDLKTIIKSNNILTSEEECYCYATDATNLIKSSESPDVVVFVESIEDVQKVLKFAYKNEIPVVSRGAGTNMVGACTTNKGGIVLNFSKMNKILEINPSNMTARVQPGVILGDLKTAVEGLGLFFPPDPSNYKVSTVGGAIAQSSGGAMTFKYGTTKDYVLSLKVVTSDGKLMTLGANTIKDAVGYHLAQLMVGSEGTLAIIVEAELKLIPKPETRRAVSAYFDSVEDAVKAVDNIIDLQIFPAAIDFMDKNAIKTVEEYSHCGLNLSKEGLLLIELDGYSANMDYLIQTTTQALNDAGITEIRIASSEKESEDIWQARRVSFAATTRLAPDVVTDDIIVPRHNLGKIVRRCNEIADKYNLKLCMVGHIGDGNLHPQIALDLEDETELKTCMEAKSEMYNAAIELGGTISAEHGVGIEKIPYLRSVVDSNAIEYMKMIKRMFDPKNILNPGKIFEL